MELIDNNILKFWQWFVKNESIIKECIENEQSTHRDYVVEQMNEQILSMGVFTWNIGLNDDNAWFLMLSPNGNHEMLKVSQKIMSEAPEHMNWLFYASKPEKEWNRQFTIYDDFMDEQLIDASPWHYIVFEEDDGKLELIFEVKNTAHLSHELAETAAEEFVAHELGEEIRILHVSSIIVVESLETEFESSKNSVSDLKEQVIEILQTKG